MAKALRDDRTAHALRTLPPTERLTLEHGRPDLRRIDGSRLSLRLITPDDADYVFGLRTDPRYNTHLSAVAGTAEDQRAWIERYKAREALGQEFYYVIERPDRVRCGLIRLYDIVDDTCTWGSWILDESKPHLAALESAVLSFVAAFERLGLSSANIDVRHENLHAMAFYRRFGMTEVRRDDENVYFRYDRTDFEKDLSQHLRAIGLQKHQ